MQSPMTPTIMIVPSKDECPPEPKSWPWILTAGAVGLALGVGLGVAIK